MGSTPFYNIVQFFHLPGGYASLYGCVSSHLRNNLNNSLVSCESAKLLWIVLVRKLVATRKHEDWVEKWTYSALTYGLESGPARRGYVPLAKADSLALFTDFSWYLLSNDELKAIEMLNVSRSDLNLAMLPSGFKVTDVVVIFNNHTPSANTSTLLDKNTALIDDHVRVMRPTKDSKFRKNRGRPPSSAATRKKKKKRSLQLEPLPLRTEDSDIGEELPSITLPNPRFQPKLVETQLKVVFECQSTVLRSSSETSEPTATAEHSMSIIERTSNPPAADTEGSVELYNSEDLPLSKRKHVEGYKEADLTNKPPRKRRGVISNATSDPNTAGWCTNEPFATPKPQGERVANSESNESTAATFFPSLSSEAAAQERQQNTSGSAKGSEQFDTSGEWVNHLLTPLARRRESREAATKAQDTLQKLSWHLSRRKKKTNVQAQKRAVTNITLREETTIVATKYNKAAKEKKIREKNSEQHVDDMDVSTSSMPSAKQMKKSKKLLQIQEQMAVDTVSSSSEENTNTLLADERQTLEPAIGENGNVAIGKLDPGRKKGHNYDIRGKGRGRKTREDKKNKEIEMPFITAGFSSPHIINDRSSSTASSTAVESSSSSRTAFSSPVFPSTGKCLPSDENSRNDEIGVNVQLDFSTPINGLSSSFLPATENVGCLERLISLSQDDDLEDYDSMQQSNLTISLSQSNKVTSQLWNRTEFRYKEVPPCYNSCVYTKSPETLHAPWSVRHDETNYSNNSRPPGSNDTHFWSPVESLGIDFPPLEGDSLFSNTWLSKPKLLNPPPVWSHSRQELCESLSYFRAYQGGVYTQKQRAEGYLLDGYPARYDLWHSDGRYIISHGGGHSALDRLTGRVSLVEDQVADAGSCAALISSWKTAHAVVLIAGSGYRLFPYSLDDMNYVVLGYYHIVHAWEEPEPSPTNSRGYCVRWKFLFRWIEAQGSPWWLSKNDGSKLVEMPLDPSVCKECGQHSYHTFGYGWVCTHSNCRAFYKLLDKSDVTTEGYASAFLARREDPLELKALKLDIRPRPPVLPVISDDIEQAQIATSRHFWKGFWCEKCGKLSCREFWTYWKCSNCDHTLNIKAIIQLPPKINNVKSERFVALEAGITEVTSRLGCGFDTHECHTFTLPFNRGRIHLIKASGQSLQNADRIFRQYQLDASNDETFFRRYSMKTALTVLRSTSQRLTPKIVKGRMLSHYFSQNSGEPYEYVGGTKNTVDLYTYKSVTRALDYIRARATLALKYNPEFNEVLSAGYMEEQKMEFHSDGEKDLGPIVASLSLGSPAIMKFRPVPSKWRSDDGQLKPEGRKTPPVLIELTLRHGDALVMEGADIQEYYQVSYIRSV